MKIQTRTLLRSSSPGQGQGPVTVVITSRGETRDLNNPMATGVTTKVEDLLVITTGEIDTIGAGTATRDRTATIVDRAMCAAPTMTDTTQVVADPTNRPIDMAVADTEARKTTTRATAIAVAITWSAAETTTTGEAEMMTGKVVVLKRRAIAWKGVTKTAARAIPADAETTTIVGLTSTIETTEISTIITTTETKEGTTDAPTTTEARVAHPLGPVVITSTSHSSNSSNSSPQHNNLATSVKKTRG